MMIMQQTIQDKSLRGESPPPSRLVLAPGCREESGLEPEQNTAAPQLPNLLTWLWAQDLLIRVKRAASSRGHEWQAGRRQLGCLNRRLSRVSHFNSNLKCISNTGNSSLSLSLLLVFFFPPDILICMWLAGSKLWIVLSKLQLAGNTCQSCAFISQTGFIMKLKWTPLDTLFSGNVALWGVDTVF